MTHATVETWDAVRGAVVCLDSGRRISCPPAAVTAGGWRALRTGQRVALEISGDLAADGVVTTVRPWAETTNEPAP